MVHDAGRYGKKPGRACWALATDVHAYMTFDTPSTAMSPPEVLLIDIMDTVVYDPFRQEIPDYFGTDIEALLEAKHPTAWQEFERHDIDASTFYDYFLEGGRTVDGEELRETLREAYRFVDGMEAVLERLDRTGYEMHAFSNYPIWYQIIESKLELSRFLDWTFVSWKTGYRKPNDAAYSHVLESVQAPAEACLFVDNRSENCEAARAHGIDALRFEGADQLRAELQDRSFNL